MVSSFLHWDGTELVPVELWPHSRHPGCPSEGLRLGRGGLRFLASLAGHSVVKSPIQGEEQLMGGHKPGVRCTDFDRSLPLAFTSPRKRTVERPTERCSDVSILKLCS